MIWFSGLVYLKYWKYKIGIVGLVCIVVNIVIYD